MRVEQMVWTEAEGWSMLREAGEAIAPQLVLFFGARSCLQNAQLLADIREKYPGAELVGCSTAGEIADTRVFDGSLVVVAVEFHGTRVRVVDHTVDAPELSRTAGVEVSRALLQDDLAHVLVLSEGLYVNGSELVQGLTSTLPQGISVTGGLAGDADAFQTTILCHNERVGPKRVIGVGFYGTKLRVGFGSLGGWDQFGPDRLITRAERNVLYELDGEPALALYKRYLGPYSEGLPASGLLFPLSLKLADTAGERVVRTILAVDEAAGSLTFAGDVPEGSYARLMKANMDRLIDGAHGAAQQSQQFLGADCELGILISCVGRKLVLKQRVEEEVECVRDVLGSAALSGFYSYGEISPFTPNARCELHNQTMTITTLSEAR